MLSKLASFGGRLGHVALISLISISLAFVACDKNEGDLLPDEPQEQPETPE